MTMAGTRMSTRPSANEAASGGEPISASTRVTSIVTRARVAVAPPHHGTRRAADSAMNGSNVAKRIPTMLRCHSSARNGGFVNPGYVKTQPKPQSA